MIVELFIIGYPVQLFRAVLHDMPPVPAALKARKLFRTWSRGRTLLPHSMPRDGGNGGGGGGALIVVVLS